MIPRDYQTAAVSAVWDYFGKQSGHPIVVMPTGTGKSLVAALLIKGMVTSYPQTRILCLTHVKELIENNYNTLVRIWPSAPAGVYSAGLGRKDVHAQITFAGIASIHGRSRLFSKTDIILIDECHLVGQDASSRYVSFIRALVAHNPKLKVIGLSATPFRMGMGHLTEGDLFTDVCFDLSDGEAFVWMIQQGYLSRIVPKRPSFEIDTSKVGIQNGEFASGSLNAAIDEQGAVERAIDETCREARDRHKWLVFTSSIDHANEAAELLRQRGVPALAVHSKMKGKDRDAAIDQFKRGAIRALVNKDILTTGFDVADIDCIACLRPSRSAGLWVQMLGRGTRPVYAPGFDTTTQEGRLAAIAAGPKQNCLVLDFAGNTRTLGPINYPTLPKRRGSGGGEPPVRACPQCETYVHISLAECPECGYMFPRESKLGGSAATEELVAMAPPEPKKPPVYEEVEVQRMVGSRHSKPGKPDSVRVVYYVRSTGPKGQVGRAVNEFVGLDHKGWFRIKALKWCRFHGATANTTGALIEQFDLLKAPVGLRLRIPETGYPEIAGYKFTGDKDYRSVG